MRRKQAIFAIISMLFVGFIAPDAMARKARKTKTPPKPMNKEVKYEAYKGTDVSQIIYKTSRKEFRVGHSPYLPLRFHMAEFILVTTHLSKYLRPDFKAEIKMAPGKGKPKLMANKTFQDRWHSLVKDYEKISASFAKFKHPKEAEAAFAKYKTAMKEELALARKVSERMFAGQGIRARERVCEELKGKFRARDAEWFDRLCAEFQENGNLSKFFPRFLDLLVKPSFDLAKNEAEKAMQKVGLEYATAVEEQGDIIAP